MPVVGPQARLAITPKEARVAAGDRIELELTIGNDGDAAEDYRIDIIGIQRQWYDLSARHVALPPSSHQSVALSVHPVAGASAGRYPFKAQMTAERPPKTSASAIVDLTVTPCAVSEVTEEPPPAAGGVTEGPTPAPPIPTPAPSMAAAPAAPAAPPIPAQPERASTRRSEASPILPAAQSVPASPQSVQGAAEDAAPWTEPRDGELDRRRRTPFWLLIALLVVVLGGAEIFLVFGAAHAPSPAAGSGAAPTKTATGARRQRTPYGVVSGAVAQDPIIARFTLLPRRGGHPAELVWSTRGARRVTINGAPAPTSGARPLRAPVEGARYQLDARNGARHATAQVRVTRDRAVIPASQAPSALFNLTEVAFAPTRAGTTAPRRVVRMVNLGPTSLGVASVAIIGGDATDFHVFGSCAGASIRPDDGCSIDIGFRPGGRGLRHATLMIADNTAGSPHTIALSGLGR